jgi:hypothetical protein
VTDRRPYSFTRPAPRLDPAGPYQAWPLEASAGTGKTWTIENLVADYLADGEISVEEVAIVTFTRAAANELRSRCVATSTRLFAVLARPSPIATTTTRNVVCCATSLSRSTSWRFRPFTALPTRPLVSWAIPWWPQ